MIDIYEEIVKIKEAGEEAALATIVSTEGSTPRETGAKMLIKSDGSIIGTIGGGSLEAEICKKALDIIKKNQPQRVHFDLKPEQGEQVGMICGGDVEVFIEPIVPLPNLYIFGAGHVSQPVAKIGKMVGFQVTVIDDRAEYANTQRFSEVDALIADNFTSVFSKLKISKSAYIVIVTRNHQYDELVLERAIQTKAKYIGMIGSATKNKTIFSHLRAKGISQKKLDKVNAPIGLEIYARTPEEIAVSIMAKIIEVRRSLELKD